MTPTEQKKIRELAIAYSNPFYLTYAKKSPVDIIAEVKPLLSMPGAVICFYDQLQKSTKLNFDSTRDEFRKQFFELYEVEPENMEMSSALYAEQKKELALAAARQFLESKGSPDPEHLENWRTIQKNLKDPEFEKPFIQHLRDSRSSEILFRKKLETAEKHLNNQDYFRKARDEFSIAAKDRPVQSAPKEQGLLQRIGRRLGLSDGPSI